jgi:hypothetical protein
MFWELIKINGLFGIVVRVGKLAMSSISSLIINLLKMPLGMKKY